MNKDKGFFIEGKDFGKNLINDLKEKNVIDSNDSYTEYVGDEEINGLLSLRVNFQEEDKEKVSEYLEMLTVMIHNNTIKADDLIACINPIFNKIKFNCPSISGDGISCLSLYAHGYIQGLLDYYAVRKQIEIIKILEEKVEKEFK